MFTLHELACDIVARYPELLIPGAYPLGQFGGENVSVSLAEQFCPQPPEHRTGHVVDVGLAALRILRKNRGNQAGQQRGIRDQASGHRFSHAPGRSCRCFVCKAH